VQDILTNDSDNFPIELQNVIDSSNIFCEGRIVAGTILDIDKKNGLVVVDVGLKSEGVIPISEFFFENEIESIAIGKNVDVYIDKLDCRRGGSLVSHSKAIRERSLAQIEHAFKNDETVTGIAFSRVKGGVSVDFSGVIAFLPGSQIDIRPVKDISHIIGKKIEYKVLSIDANRSIIVSRKVILESARSVDRDQFLSSVHEGDIIEGVVKNITNYGAFVDLGDIDGLLHITDISWEKITHPSEVLHVGQRVMVKIVKYDRESRRLSLGMKHLINNPWMVIGDKYKIGDTILGKITNVATYGVFVQLEPGIEGLLHVSEIGWTKDTHRKHKEMQVDNEISVIITDIDIDKHRISLSLKQLTENPWDKFARNHNTGEILNGTIRNVTDFGIFVGIEGEEVDGLVHISDLSWGGNTATEMVKYKKDSPIQVIYLGADAKNQRIRFGIKQLTDDPFAQYSPLIEKDKIVTCKVVGIRQDGIEVELFDCIRSFIKKNDLARDRTDRRVNRFVLNDRIDVKVVSFNEATRKLVLSVKAHEEDELSKTIQEYGSADTGATIGSILGDAIHAATQKASKLDNAVDNDIQSSDD